MQLIEVNSQSYAYKIHQRDEELPSLVMLHGFMGDHRVFHHLVASLCKYCNPVTLDLLGHGKSTKPGEPERYREDHQCHDLCEILNKLDLGPVFLLGYSMGGRLALKLALTAPDVIQGLILESTTCGIHNAKKRKKRREMDEQRAQLIENDFALFLADWEKLALFQSPLPVKEKLVEAYKQIHLDQDSKAMAASLRGFGSGSMSSACSKLRQLKMPVRIIAGSEDEKYQNISQFMAKQLPDAVFSSVQAGHRTHLDNPPAFLTEIKNYLTQHHNYELENR